MIITTTKQYNSVKKSEWQFWKVLFKNYKRTSHFVTSVYFYFKLSKLKNLYTKNKLSASSITDGFETVSEKHAI